VKPEVVLAYEFVEYIPAELKDGTIYVSMAFATAAHKCVCGCGSEVVTPLSPTDWQLLFDGVSISLTPSIGNWNFPCRSHYWIRHNKIIWARSWSQQEIEAGRTHDRRAKEQYLDSSTPKTKEKKPNETKSKRGGWQKFKQRFL
jgi:hypothetical protein